MSKKRQKQNMQKRITPTQMKRLGVTLDPEIFGSEGKEPLTEALIAELVERGWDESELRTAASMGAMYSRPRKSIILPPRGSF